jgi:hypothetical protein
MGQNVLKGMLSDGEKGPPTPSGLRMHGSYGGQGGIMVEFFPESAIISCGDAARAYPYNVQISGALPAIKLEDVAHPVILTMKSDGDLDSGSGPYEVHGRTITGQNDNGDYTFAPLNMTCNLGLLKPGAAPSAPPPSAAATAAAKNAAAVDAALAKSTGNAVLSVSTGFPPQPGILNPLAGRPYLLMRDDFATAAAKGGVPIPPGMSAEKAMGAACANRTPDCQKFTQAMTADTACALRADVNGKATLPGVPPGTYYLMVSTLYNRQPLYWDLKVELKPGANSVTLDQTNTTPVK